jgi:hypothetical protein
VFSVSVERWLNVVEAGHEMTALRGQIRHRSVADHRFHGGDDPCSEVGGKVGGAEIVPSGLNRPSEMREKNTRPMAA